MLEKISVAILPVMIITILSVAMLKKVHIYEEFIEGAKDGFKVCISIIPYLVALIVAISMLRASGVMDFIALSLKPILEKFSLTPDILMLMITRPLSGSATLGIFSDIAANNGANSFITYMAAIMIGSSETTFYVLSVYFGSVGIKKFRYALITGVLADIIGIALAIWVAHLFFLPNIG